MTLPALTRYVELLTRYGAHTDLVGVRGEDAITEVALADALVLARHADHLASPLHEIGAGGASLSIPLALLIPDLHAVLWEPRQKRATFLRLATASFDLGSRITIRQERLEPKRLPEASAGCAIARAVFAPAEWIPLARRLVRPGGTYVVMATEPYPLDDLVAEEHYTLAHARATRWLGIARNA
jgi:16S rRNA G527 N7-methylase RsmG